jgi:CBS domain-containing protein
MLCRVSDVMTTEVVSVSRDTPYKELVRLLLDRGVSALPVVDDREHVVGIVSEADLLRVFLRPDDEIRREVVEDVIGRDLLMDHDRFQVEVREGVVALRGEVECRSLIPVLVRAVYGVDGVVRVDHRLGFEVDDTRLTPVTPWGLPPWP